jgi:hypothetical protein
MSETEFNGIKFKDPDFGYIPQPIKKEIPEKVMGKMVKEIKTYLK